ncbi:MAG TPA: histidinol phosphatase [Blastocatellia bacterium]|nr:histidinol phosphatase [Blastocatellia bacterium]
MKKRFIAVLLMLAMACATHSLAQTPKLGEGRKYTSVERMQIEHLRAVHQARLRYASAKRSVKLATGYADYRAILHAHAEDSSHTGGTRPELLAAAKRVGVKIILLTDHVRPERDFINDSWRGLRDGVLFIPGAESEGFLIYPQASIKSKTWKTREDYINLVKENGGDIFLSHVEERPDWDTSELQGLEIYNHHSDVKDEKEYNAWLIGAFTNSARLGDIARALSEYPEEVFGAQQDYLSAIIAKWDRDTLDHRLTGVAANDCHHNQVFTVTVVDDNTIEVGYITSRPTTTRVTTTQTAGVAELTRGRKAGDLVAKLDFDIYDRSLNYVNTHILMNKLDEATTRDALGKGHAYVAHDWLCPASGFAFIAEQQGKRIAVMGDEIKSGEGIKLRAATPFVCTLKLFHNGQIIKSAQSDHLEFAPQEKGVYRIEAWLELDGEQRPWIYSNPIYVR